MKKFLLSFLCFLLAVAGGYAEDVTLSFANKAQRTSFSKSQQVWKQNGITFTNNKASSTTDVADYAKPVRLYQNPEIVVECTLGNITQIVFDCNSNSYATALGNSITGSSVSSDKVTVTLDGNSNSFTVASLSKQVRLDALTVTYATSAGATKPVTPTLTAGGNFVGSMKVEISCATGGAEIFYTIDGTDPTEDSEAYIKPLEITDTTTVKAIAVNDAGPSNVATAVYTRVAATPEISFNEATFEESVEVTITADEGTTAYYTLNSKTPTEDSDECPETLTLRADATLQVIAYDEDGYASPIVKHTFTQKANDTSGTAGTATLVEDVTDLAVGDKVVIVASDFDVALSTTQNTNNRGCIGVTKSDDKLSVKLNNEVQILTLENGAADGQYAFYTGEDGYLYAASTASNHLKTKKELDNKASFTIKIEDRVATIKADQSVRNWLRFNSTNSPKIFSCYTSGQADVSLYEVDLSTVENYVLNVSEAGWSTLYLGYNTIIPEGVECYTISGFGEGTVSLSLVESGYLPANTAVIVKAEEGGYTFAVTEETASIESCMVGSTKNEYIDKEAYVLAKPENCEVGFYKASMNGGVFLNNANKAYLPVSALPASAQNAKALKFNFDTTGVEGVKVETAGKKVIYDLSGRRVNEMTQPGIYIVNGKKVMVK